MLLVLILSCRAIVSHFRVLVRRLEVIDCGKLLILDQFLSEHVFDLLLDGLRIKLVSLDNVWQHPLNVELVVFLDDSRVELRDSNLVLADKDDAMVARSRFFLSSLGRLAWPLHIEP